MKYITSNYVHFINAVDYCSGVTTGDFGLRIGKKVWKKLDKSNII